MYFFRNYNKSLESFHMHDTKRITIYSSVRFLRKFYPRGVNKYAKSKCLDQARTNSIKIYKTSPFEVPQRKLSSFVCPFSRNKPLLLSIQNGWIVTFIQLLALLFFSSLPSKNTHQEHFHFPSRRSIVPLEGQRPLEGELGGEVCFNFKRRVPRPARIHSRYKVSRGRSRKYASAKYALIAPFSSRNRPPLSWPPLICPPTFAHILSPFYAPSLPPPGLLTNI